ncbi:hypothetical protein ACHAWU_007703 [Discostella pseudostelligera]|uniref:Helicase-associated domain-containing protein n=1 Tax=Discostella pseudostelligera TaxID=259834 RepID=A0ABD3LYG1_9STRA
MASAAAAAVAVTTAKSNGQQQDQRHGQDSSSGPSSTAIRKEQSGESTATVTTATTLLEPAASSSSSFPAPVNANMTTLPPTAAGAAAAPKYYYNRPFPPPPPPFVFTGMPYAPHAAVPIMMMPPTTMPKKMPPAAKAKATKTTTAKKSGVAKLSKQRKLPTKATLMANNKIGNSSTAGAGNIAPPSASETAAASSSLPSAPSAATPATASSSSAPRRLKDTEFLKFVVSEFKRRGFTASIQLRPYSAETESEEPAKKKRKRKQNNDDIGKVSENGQGVETAAGTASIAAESSSSAAGEATSSPTTATTTDDSAQPTKQKRAYKKTPKPPTPTPSLSLPSFSFFPSHVIPNDKQDATWNAMYDQLCDYVKRHDGRPPFIVTPNTDAMTKDAAVIAPTNTKMPETTNETPPSSTATISTVNVDTTNDSGADNKKERDALYKWTKRQLYAWNRMKKDNMHGLSLERISKLHALNFEQHSVHAAAVAAASSASSDLAAASATASATASPASAAASTKGVAAAIVVDPDVTMKHAQKWQEKFESLKQYKELHGDTNVSRKIDRVLSVWCQTQRVRCKVTLNSKGGVAAAGNVILSDNKSNPLTKEQFQLLEGIGFATSAKRKKYDSSMNDRKWEEKFQELVRFKEEHGHCEVTVRKGFDELKPLASWASTQRVSEMMSSSNLMEMTFPNFTSNPTHGFLHMFAVRRYAVKVQGETIGQPAGENNRYLTRFTCLHFFTNLSTLMFVFTTPFVMLDITDEQIIRLGSLGFSFKMRDDFETRFNQLCQFKKEFGHTKVPVFYTGHNNLGRWAKRMRDGIRDNEPWMDEVRKTRLLGIDFDTSARRVFDHPYKKSSSDEDDEDQGVASAAASHMDNADFGPSNHPYESTGMNQFYYQGYSQGSL